MDARYARPMDLNPLLSKARVVNVSNVEMNADKGTLHIVEERPEFPWGQQEALLRVTILTTNLNLRFSRHWRKLPHRVQATQVHLVVRNFFGHEPSHHKYGVATEKLSCLELALYDANRLGTDTGVARRER